MFGALAYDPMTGLAITTPDDIAADAATPAPNPTMRALQRLTGSAFGEPRMQTWPEATVRRGGSMGRPEEDR